MRQNALLLTLALAMLTGCGDDAGGAADAGGEDAARPDGTVGSDDAGASDGSPEPSDGGATLRFVSDFEDGMQGWEAGWTDLPVNPDDELYEREAELRALPEPLDTSRQGFYIQSHNRSDDVWMYLARRFTSADGLEAGQTYRVHLSWRFATNTPSNCAGIGGAPGESVFMKVGASPDPAGAVEEGGDLRFTLDKGNQSSAGAESTSAGNVASGLECPDDTWVAIDRSRTHEPPVTATDEGELTVFIGTDSGFEGFTPLYYDRIEVELEAVE